MKQQQSIPMANNQNMDPAEHQHTAQGQPWHDAQLKGATIMVNQPPG